MNAILATMQKHRSIRKYKDQPIDPALLKQLIATAQHASSSNFIQAYSLVRVTKPETRQAIATLAGGQHWIESTAEFFVICADLSLIEQCSEKYDLGALQGHTEHFITSTVDAALFTQNLLLAAESEGLGGVFIGGIRNDPAQVVKRLKLPKLVYPVFGLCLGWPDSDPDIKPRMPVEMILHEDEYDASRQPAQLEAYDEQIRAYYQSRQDNTKVSDWSEPTARAVQRNTREHMLEFLHSQGFLKR